jgi:hypothetical protein
LIDEKLKSIRKCQHDMEREQEELTRKKARYSTPLQED